MIRISDPHLRRIAAALFLAALLAVLWRSPAPAPTAFLIPAQKTGDGVPMPPQPGALPVAATMAGPSSLTQLADGRIAIAWLGGPDDDDSAAAIWLSTLGRDGWSPPSRALTREHVAAATFMHLNRLGRPVLHAEGGWLHLWVEALPLGAWAGGSIVHATSTDGGRSWGHIERLATSPLGGLGSGLGGSPLPLADGGIGLPGDLRLAGGTSTWLRLSATGTIDAKARLANEHANRQPAIAALDEHRALAIVRENAGESGRASLHTDNGGESWRSVPRTDLPNPDAPVALLRLNGGNLLLAGNPREGREALQLWTSGDDGKTWRPAGSVEAAADGGAEFAFPSLLQSRDGRIHLSYTWRRQAIRHAAFNEAWLNGGRP